MLCHKTVDVHDALRKRLRLVKYIAHKKITLGLHMHVCTGVLRLEDISRIRLSEHLNIVFTGNANKCIWPSFVKTLTGIVIPQITVLTQDPILISAITVSAVKG